jgi:hypothetical protein
VQLLKDSGKPEDVDKWQAWASAFASSHSTTPIAAYFKGDALARQQKYQEAIASFTQGLQRQPKHALLLNARAVCYASFENWNEAIVDLDDAARANPQLADIHANRGTLNIRQSVGAPGAKVAFTRALEISPDFYLAKIGLASALYGQGKWSDAEAMLRNLKTDNESQFLAEANLLVIQGDSIESLARLGREKSAGTAIDRNYDQVVANCRQTIADTAKMQNSLWTKVNGNYIADLGLNVEGQGDTVKAFNPKGVNFDLQAQLQQNGKVALTAKVNGNIDFGNGIHHIGSSIYDAGKTISDINNNTKAMEQLVDLDTRNLARMNENLGAMAASKVPGGVNTEDLRRGFVDNGEWGLLARFALQYPSVASKTVTTPEKKAGS